MDKYLQELARDLRKEACPPEVLDRVSERIAADAPQSIQFGRILGGAIVVLALIGAGAVWRLRLANQQLHAYVPISGEQTEQKQIAEEATGALAYIGQILIDAGARSKQVILKEAVPPLRNSLETAKSKFINQI